MDFKIVTVCNRFPTEPYYCLTEFIKSIGKHEALVLGTQPGEYKGLGDKPKLLYKAIKEGLIKEKYIIFCDCWDLVFAVDPSEFFESYLRGGDEDIFISAEKNCFPTDLKFEYDNLNSYGSPYKYLNSGMIIGKTDAILTMLDTMDLSNVLDDYRKEDGKMEHINDQFLYQQIFLKQPVKMVLDYGQVQCNTLHGVTLDELEFDDYGICNKTCGCYPMSFHFNGSAKTDGLREVILKHLNL
jgi:hypothetical protein